MSYPLCLQAGSFFIGEKMKILSFYPPACGSYFFKTRRCCSQLYSKEIRTSTILVCLVEYLAIKHSPGFRPDTLVAVPHSSFQQAVSTFLFGHY